MKIAIVHNIIWSRYRLNLFDAISSSIKDGDKLFVIQVAKTEKSRESIKSSFDVRINHHYKLLYDGFYEDISPAKRSILVAKNLVIFKYDVVLVTGYACLESWVVLILSNFFRKKIILALDSSEFEFKINSKVNFLKRFFIRKVDAVLAYGTASANLALDLGAKSNVFFPFHCLSSDYYLNVHFIVNKKRAMICKEGFLFLYVGRLSSEKGILDLILSFNAAFGGTSSVSLQIVGGGPLLNQYESLIQDLSASNICITGPLIGGELIDAYIGSNCLVLPSTVEPWGLVVNEALCLGTPVVVSDRCGCVRDLVDGNQDAIKFNAANRKDLERALREAYSRFKDFDEQRVKRCVDLGQSYSPERAAETFFRAVES